MRRARHRRRRRARRGDRGRRCDPTPSSGCGKRCDTGRDPLRHHGPADRRGSVRRSCRRGVPRAAGERVRSSRSPPAHCRARSPAVSMTAILGGSVAVLPWTSCRRGADDLRSAAARDPDSATASVPAVGDVPPRTLTATSRACSRAVARRVVRHATPSLPGPAPSPRNPVEVPRGRHPRRHPGGEPHGYRDTGSARQHGRGRDARRRRSATSRATLHARRWPGRM